MGELWSLLSSGIQYSYFHFHFLMLSSSPLINSFFSFASVALVRPDQHVGTDPDPSRSIRSYQTMLLQHCCYNNLGLFYQDLKGTGSLQHISLISVELISVLSDKDWAHIFEVPTILDKSSTVCNFNNILCWAIEKNSKDYSKTFPWFINVKPLQ